MTPHNHAGHRLCLQRSWARNSLDPPRCPTCRKSTIAPEGLRAYWNKVRYAISCQPLRLEMGAVRAGDQFSTRYGPFVVESMEKIITSISDNHQSTHILSLPPVGLSAFRPQSPMLPQLLSPPPPPPVLPFSLDHPSNYLYRGRFIRWQLGPQAVPVKVMTR